MPMPRPNSQDPSAGSCDVSSLTGLGPVLHQIIRHCSSLFGHVVRFPEDTPANQNLIVIRERSPDVGIFCRGNSYFWAVMHYDFSKEWGQNRTADPTPEVGVS